jgi:glycosyltransferase involved in cell wall biosynthesis
VTIVLPTFNEAGTVGDAVANAVAAARRAAYRHEVVVVDDGSSDGTRALVSRCVEADRRVRLVVHPLHLGYGAAVRSGIRAARMPWILLTDADLQFDLGELEDFLSYAPHADLILGWRILCADRLDRRINTAAWNWLVRRVFNVPVRDVDCAFKLVRRELAQRCELTSDGAMISTELVVKCAAQGARLREVGVHQHARVAGRHSHAAAPVVGRSLRKLAALRRGVGGRPSSPVTG